MHKTWTYRPPGSTKQYHPLKVLRAIFARSANPRPKGGGGRRRKPKPRPSLKRRPSRRRGAPRPKR